MVLVKTSLIQVSLGMSLIKILQNMVENLLLLLVGVTLVEIVVILVLLQQTLPLVLLLVAILFMNTKNLLLKLQKTMRHLMKQLPMPW